MGILEWGATIISLIYLYYAVKNKPVCFVYGIISSALWAFSVYKQHLLFDTGLQVFYIVMSIVGLYRWKYGGNQNEELPITRLSLSTHILLIFLGSVVSIGLYYSSSMIEVINKPFLDAITTVFLIIGTFLLIEKKLYSWVYLVLADFGYVYIYGTFQMWLFVGVMTIYIIAGTIGFMQWKKIITNQKITST